MFLMFLNHLKTLNVNKAKNIKTSRNKIVPKGLSYIYIYRYRYHIYIYVCVCVYVCIYICMHMHMHMYMYMYLYMYMYIYMFMYIYQFCGINDHVPIILMCTTVKRLLTHSHTFKAIVYQCSGLCGVRSAPYWCYECLMRVYFVPQGSNQRM